MVSAYVYMIVTNTLFWPQSQQFLFVLLTAGPVYFKLYYFKVSNNDGTKLNIANELLRIAGQFHLL